jgi:hypothetical protein
MTWASSHLSHKHGGLKICYILQNIESTMLPTIPETARTQSMLGSQRSGITNIFRHHRSGTVSSGRALKPNDLIEARSKTSHWSERYTGRIVLKIAKSEEPFLIMSTHVIVDSIPAKPYCNVFFPRRGSQVDKLDGDWNELVEIWASNEIIGQVSRSFDNEAEVYPNGYRHDVTLIKPTAAASVQHIASPIDNLG